MIDYPRTIVLPDGSCKTLLSNSDLLYYIKEYAGDDLRDLIEVIIDEWETACKQIGQLADKLCL